MYADQNQPRVLSGSSLEVSSVDMRGHYFEHESLPDKVIRWQEINIEDVPGIPLIKKHLKSLELDFYIPTVHTEFIISDSSEACETAGMVTLVMISDKITECIESDQALQRAANDMDVAKEFDSLSVKLLCHLEDVIHSGGVFVQEYYHYYQYVYSDQQNLGERLILVDTEPLGAHLLPVPSKRHKNSVSAYVLETLAHVCSDILKLESDGIKWARPQGGKAYRRGI